MIYLINFVSSIHWTSGHFEHLLYESPHHSIDYGQSLEGLSQEKLSLVLCLFFIRQAAAPTHFSALVDCLHYWVIESTAVSSYAFMGLHCRTRHVLWWTLSPFPILQHCSFSHLFLDISNNISPRQMSLGVVYPPGANIIKSTLCPIHFPTCKHLLLSLTPGQWAGCPTPAVPSHAAGTVNREKNSTKILPLGHRAIKCGHMA